MGGEVSITPMQNARSVRGRGGEWAGQGVGEVGRVGVGSRGRVAVGGW